MISYNSWTILCSHSSAHASTEIKHWKTSLAIYVCKVYFCDTVCNFYYHISSPTIFLIHNKRIRKRAVTTAPFPDNKHTCEKDNLIDLSTTFKRSPIMKTESVAYSALHTSHPRISTHNLVTSVCEIGMKSSDVQPYFRVAISPGESLTIFIVLLSLDNHDVYHKS